MDDKEKMNLERAELDAIIRKGITFEVDDVEIVTERRLFGLLPKRVVKPVRLKFTVHEPTLGTLDRLSREWVEFEIDENELKNGDDAMRNARTLAYKHARRAARIVAIATLGTDYLKPVATHGGVVRYRNDDRRLDELTDLFARRIKPSMLYQLYTLISLMCNLGDFVNSMRLMSADRTTNPNRIEQEG